MINKYCKHVATKYIKLLIVKKNSGNFNYSNNFSILLKMCAFSFPQYIYILANLPPMQHTYNLFDNHATTMRFCPL